jgi:hypothetical protein
MKLVVHSRLMRSIGNNKDVTLPDGVAAAGLAFLRWASRMNTSLYLLISSRITDTISCGFACQLPQRTGGPWEEWEKGRIDVYVRNGLAFGNNGISARLSGGIVVNTSVTLKSELGLRHLIEDAIGILRGSAFPDARRNFVLTDLQDLFHKVVRGHELIQSPSFFVGTADRGAFEAFSLLDRFLPPSGAVSVQDALRASADRLAELKDGHVVPVEQRQESAAFLSKILASLERQDSSGLRNEPEPHTIGG